MPQKGSPYRILLILMAVALLIVPAAVIFLNNSVSLTGTAVRQDADPADTGETSPESSGDDESAGEAQPDEKDEQNPQDEGESASEGDDEQTGGDTVISAPTQAPTSIPPTPAPTAAPEVTEEPQDDEDTADSAETTEEPDAESTDEPQAEATAEATAEPVVLDVALVCGAAGVEFTVTNSGADMPQPEIYSIDDEPAGEFQLATGESITIQSDFGTPLFSAAGMSAQPDEPCLPPPALNLTAVCTAEDGAVFVIINDGGPMREPQTYTINNEALGEFQLDAGGETKIRAGYGSPTFASADISAALEEACNPPGSISGLIWLDADGDGAPGDGEPALAGLTITLTGSGGTQETTSADDGRYGFIHLLPGQYTISVTNPPANTLPTTSAADSSMTVTVEFEAASASFGYQPQTTGAVSGVVWADLNGDGLRGDDEPGLSAITVTLRGADGDSQAVSDASGVYRFVGLAAGDYTVSIDSDALSADFLITAGASATVTVADSPVSGPDFGLQPARLGSISGLIWLETHDFGVRNPGETGIVGVVIELLDSAGTVLRSVTLEAEGTFAFADLLPGKYTLRISEESLPDRLFITHNPDGSRAFSTQITLPPGADVENIEFGLVGAF